MFLHAHDCSKHSSVIYLVPLDNSLFLASIYDSAWRHWGCTTTVIINNMKRSFTEADELDGFDELQPEDQDRIRKAWDDGHVADEDVPETARKPEKADDASDDEKPKKKRAPPKKDDAGDVAKPKKARTSKKVRHYSPCFPTLAC